MIRNLTIKVKLIIYVTLILCGAILFVSLSTYFTSRNELSNTIRERFSVLTELKSNDIQTHFDNIHSGIKLLQNSKVLQKHLPQYLTYKDSPYDSIRSIAYQHKITVDDEFLSIQEAYGYDRVILIDPKNLKAFDGLEESEKLHKSITKNLISQSYDTIVHTDVFKLLNKNTTDELYHMYVLAPMHDTQGNVETIMAIEIELNNLFRSIQNKTGLGETGELLIGKLINNEAIILNTLRSDEFSALNLKIKIGHDKALPIQDAVNGKSGHGNSIDYKGTKVLAIWKYIPEVKWGLVFKIDQKEVFKPLAKLKGRVVIMSTVLLVFVILISAIFADRFLKPIMMIRDNIISLANGRFPHKIKYFKNDEIGETVKSLNIHIKNLKTSTEFASKIGEGDLDFSISEEGKNDVLSSSLISMKNSLIQVSEENDRRKWATEGQALHVEILRNNSKNIEQLCNELIQSLIPYVGGNYGAMFTVETERKSKYLLLRSTYAYHNETKTERLEFGQSLVGQCALEKKTIQVNEIPKDFVKLSSGLGDTYPSHLIIVPLMVNEEIYGVMEIGSFETLKDYQIEFLEKLGESIGSTILAVQSTEKNEELLASFQKSSLASAKVAVVDKLKEQKAKLKEENKALKEEIEALKDKLGE